MRILTARSFGKLIVLSFLGLFSPRAEADIMCKWFWYCVYESPGFRIVVVDKETGQSLSDVYAMAEWVQYGYHGSGGPLMVQEAVSGPDGVLVFPAWGPLSGSSGGLELNRDPVITLFKPGYKATLINNAPGRDERARVRGFTQSAKTFTMASFRGSSEEWVKELEKAAYPTATGLSASEPENIRRIYLSRTQRVKVEVERLPPNRKDVARLLDALQRSIKFLQEGK